AAELESGEVEEDQTLGLVFKQAPAEEDDLTRIKGVAGVLKGKLNDFGVYRFKQIALWNDAVIEEFAERLSFKDRIQRDDWRTQAKELHEEKYGEKL
ncbi:MAG: 50S ribosomal protein L21, partial [Verrucomicrobiota bacterium]